MDHRDYPRQPDGNHYFFDPADSDAELRPSTEGGLITPDAEGSDTDYRYGVPADTSDRTVAEEWRYPRPPLPYEHPAGHGVRLLREQTVQELVATPLVKGEIVERILGNTAFATLYPLGRVPERFIQDHPTIRFMPPRVHVASLERYEAGEGILYSYSSGLSTTRITSAEELADRLVDIRAAMADRIDPRALYSLMDDAFRGLTEGLELHRLTDDPTGLVIRYSREPQIDSPFSFIEPARITFPEDHSDIDFRYLHPDLLPEAAVSWVTTWYRDGARESDVQQADAAGTVRIENTIFHLEHAGTIALDTSRGMSLMLLRNSYPR